MLSCYLVFCRRAVSTAILFSSLICWQPVYGIDTALGSSGQIIQIGQNNIRQNAITSLLARATYPAYTIPAIGAIIPPEGFYSSIVVPSPGDGSVRNRPDFYIRTGTVTLANDTGLLFDVSYKGLRQANDSIFIQPNGAGAAVLRLVQGKANGSINLIPNAYGGSYYSSSLLIGPDNGTSADDGSVTITGHIDGLSQSIVAGDFSDGRAVTVETQGANLIVNGAIGFHNGLSFITYLKAHNGNIEVKVNSDVYASDGRVNAFIASAQNGYHIEAAHESRVYGVDLGENSSFRVTDDGIIVVLSAIGDPEAHGGGKMAAGSTLEAADFLELWGGVQQASGTMKARLRSILTHDPTRTPQSETLEAAINQNSSDPLTLEAGQDVMAGGINVDTITAGRDIISGSVSGNGSTPAKGHIFLNAGGDGFHYPRSPITANTITATQASSTTATEGRVIAGELNMPRQADKSASLTASHLMLIKQDAEGNLPASTGDFTMVNGQFRLTATTPVTFFMGDGKTSLNVTEATENKFPVVNLEGEYASYVGNNMTLTNTQGSFTSLKVVNESNATGGLLSGTLLQTGSATFTQLSTTDIDELRTDNDFTATSNGKSSVNTAKIGGTAAISGGSWQGDTFSSGATTSFANVNNVNITDTATIGTSLAMTDSTGSIANLQTGTGMTITGGSLTAGKLLTGATNNANGDVTVANGSFSFGVDSSEQSHIQGNLSSPSLKKGAFGDLKADGAVNVTGGTLSGQSLTAASAELTNNSINSNILNISGKFTAAGNVNSNIETANIAGDASVSGALFTGGTFTAANATFEDVSTLAINKELSGKNITLTGAGERKIEQATATQQLTVSGGSYEGTGIKAASASFENTSSVNVSGSSVIDGNLTASGNSNLAFAQLETGGNIEITGGAFTAPSIKAGTSGQGNVTLNTKSFSLGTGSSDSIIHGDLISSGNGSGSIGTLTVDGNLSVNGGFVEGANLTAGGGILKNKSHAHIENLDLTGTGVFLDIEAGSVLTVGSLKGAAANSDALIQSGSLILLGSADSLHTVSLPNTDFTLGEGGALEDPTNNYLVEIRNLDGQGKGASVDDIRVHQLKANNIEIEDANLFLTGLGQYASRVANDLIIRENGDTRLGDMNVGGTVDITGGSVTGRQFTTGSDASFSNVALTLSGSGMQVDPVTHEVTLNKAGSIGGNLVLTNENASQLGDINVKGSLTSTGGSVEAGILAAGGDVTMTGSDLSLNGLKGSPSYIKGNLALNDNKNSSLWHLDVDGNITGNDGKIAAHVLNVGGYVSLKGVELSLRTLEGQQGNIKGKLTLTDNKAANLGNISVKGDITVNSGTVEATGLHGHSNAIFSGVELTLNGDADNPDKIDGNLALSGNSAAILNVIEIGGETSAKDGSVTASSLTSQNMKLDGAISELTTAKVLGNADISGGSLNSNNFTANDLTLRNGLKTALEEVMLDGSSKKMTVGSAQDTVGNTDVNIAALNLNGGNLTVGNVQTEPVSLAVRNFSQASDGSRSINGNMGVGVNGALILGSRDTSFVPKNLAYQHAVLALAQPARLGAGYGLHITGADAPAPAANQIRFDAASLFVIDGSDSRAYYTGEYIKSALLGPNRGAVGALSADKATVTASVGPGAQIYIRNPLPNTVIVALGENINTIYTDQDVRIRDGEGNAWKDANLKYDNADKVKIERLDGEYAGQFSVVPVTREPDNPTPTPDTPGQPENPTPDTPSQPVTPTPTPDTPEQPENPTPTPDTPGQPENPTPAKPSKPAKPTETHPGAHPGIHDAITNETNNGTVGGEPHHLAPNNGAGFLSHTIIHDTPQEATRLVEGSLRMPIIGAVPQLIKTANDAGESAMSARTELAGFMMREDDLHARSVALWAVPLYKTAGGWELTAGNHDYDYHGGIGGIAIGGDYTIEDILRFGISFNIGGGYSKSGGDLPETTNNMSFWGLGAYGVWSFGNFGLSGNIAYTSSYNKLKQEISHLQGWSELKSDLQAHALSAGLRLEYCLDTDFLNIYPHIGARYHYIHADDYSITHRGDDIVKGDGFSQNIWSFPVGILFAKDFAFDNGWKLTPQLDLRVTPAAGDIKVKTTSRFTGTSTDISLKTQTMDYITYGGSIGVEGKFNNFTLGVNYSLDAGLKTVSNTIFGTLRYEF